MERKLDAIAALMPVVLLVYGLALYPAVLRHTTDCGWDAPSYWEAGRGDFTPKWNQASQQYIVGYISSDRTLGPWRILARLDYPEFLAVIHAANCIGLAAVVSAVLRQRRRYPILAWSCAIFVGACASDILASANIAPTLCWMSLSPVGSLLAVAVKPAYLLVVVLHAALFAAVRWGKWEVRRAG